jgi:hypothetical protein
MPIQDSKLENAILHLLKRSAAQRPPLTVLLKMLWFVDYSHYSAHLSSVTGARYVAMTRGPAVDGYKALFERMETNGQLSQEKVPSQRFPDQQPTQYYTAIAAADTSMFTETELDAMEAVIAKCAHKTGRELSAWTHEVREPWALVWDEEHAPKHIPEVVWRWSVNLPDETDLALAREDVSRVHVRESLEKLRAEQQPANAG